MSQAPVVKAKRLVAQSIARGGTLVVRGRTEIVALQPMLMELAALSGLGGSLDDLEHFMMLPRTTKRTPYLVLHPAGRGEMSVWGINGATLLFDYGGLPGGRRVFSTTDRCGRRSVLAASSLRAKVAAHAARTMMQRGGQVVLLRFSLPGEGVASGEELTGALREGWQDGSGEASDPLRRLVSEGGNEPQALWTCHEEAAALYLPLEDSYEKTVAPMSHKMRFNLGYYRRLAERELGSEFVPVVQMSLEEFLEVSRSSMYAVTDSLAKWRFHSLKRLSDPLLCGVRDKQGGWLSVLGGRRSGQSVEIDWVMNRDGLARYSLGTVVRSYLMEHECRCGTKRLYVEGGTSHGTGRSFVRERVVELTVKRPSPYVSLLTLLAGLRVMKGFVVPLALRNPDSEWQPW